jgi:hypothetical protein
MPMRRPRLPVLATLISLAIVAFLTYSSPQEWSLSRLHFGITSDGESLKSDAQIIEGIHSVSIPTTLPAPQASDRLKPSHTTILPENSIDQPAIITEDSTKDSKETIQSLKTQQVEHHHAEVAQFPSHEIPNIFHFTHLQANPQTLDIGFQQFIAIYSAYYYCKPSKIYIHTNVNPRAFRQARRSGNQWTRKIANMPIVHFNHQLAPNASRKGVAITKLAHQSDYIRTRVMKKWGGIFMDEDSYLLKDLTVLRQSGFRNVVARQVDGKVGCGMFLSVPESQLVTAYQILQDRVYDGRWTTHSVDLFTRVVDEFSVFEKEVLVMDHTAFFPLSWKPDDLATIYQVSGPANNRTTSNRAQFNVTSFVSAFEMKPKNTEQDWKTSFALHGFNSEVKGSERFFGDFGGITLDYVLARNSNFARAIYPAIKHALADITLVDNTLH